MKKGSLVVVGTGILTPAHLSQESIDRIETADIVHVLVTDALGMSTIKKLNRKIKNLGDLYYDPNSDKNGSNRLEAYNLMVESILKDVRSGLKVCAIFYGHPGVFVYPSHVSIEKAKEEGFEAKMLPAISAEDCLFADLGVDPGEMGCQAYEASQFMFYKHSINVHAALVLWQVGVAGELTFTKLKPAKNGLLMLKDRLLDYYPEEHKITLYEATTLPMTSSRTENILIQNLEKIKVRTVTTLYIPPLCVPKINDKFSKKWNIDTSNL